MNKAALTAFALSVVLVSLVAEMQAVEMAEANYYFIGPLVSVYSPSSSAVYTNTSVPLHVVAIVHANSSSIECFFYSVDGNSNVTLTNLTREQGSFEFHATSVLENLAEGNHTLKVYSRDASGGEMTASVEFMIDTHIKSPLLVVSPQNITYPTYNTTDIALIVIYSGEEIRSTNYRLDDKVNELGGGEIYFDKNLTLTGLPIGSHKIEVVARTEKEVFSQTIYFSVAEPEPFPTIAVLTIIGVSTITCIGFVAYFKKHNHKAKVIA